jgi:hypothetical protein
MFRKMMIATAMLSMSATAAVAAPVNPAANLSLQNAPTTYSAATPKRKSEVVPVLIGLGIVGAVAYLVIDKENDDDKSDSN